MSAANEPHPRRVYFRLPEDWDELTEEERLTWAKRVIELVTAQANPEP